MSTVRACHSRRQNTTGSLSGSLFKVSSAGPERVPRRTSSGRPPCCRSRTQVRSRTTCTIWSRRATARRCFPGRRPQRSWVNPGKSAVTIKPPGRKDRRLPSSTANPPRRRYLRRYLGPGKDVLDGACRRTSLEVAWGEKATPGYVQCCHCSSGRARPDSHIPTWSGGC